MKPRSFKVHDRGTLQRVAGLLSQMLVSEAKPILIEVSPYSEQRSSAQNRLLHAILRDVADSLEVNGKRFSQEAWKEMFRRQFLGLEEVILPTGEIIEQGKSTTKATVAEMTEAIDRFQAWLASDFGYLAEMAA